MLSKRQMIRYACSIILAISATSYAETDKVIVKISEEESGIYSTVKGLFTGSFTHHRIRRSRLKESTNRVPISRNTHYGFSFRIEVERGKRLQMATLLHYPDGKVWPSSQTILNGKKMKQTFHFAGNDPEGEYVVRVFLAGIDAPGKRITPSSRGALTPPQLIFEQVFEMYYPEDI